MPANSVSLDSNTDNSVSLGSNTNNSVSFGSNTGNSSSKILEELSRLKHQPTPGQPTTAVSDEVGLGRVINSGDVRPIREANPDTSLAQQALQAHALREGDQAQHTQQPRERSQSQQQTGINVLSYIKNLQNKFK